MDQNKTRKTSWFQKTRLNTRGRLQNLHKNLFTSWIYEYWKGRHESWNMSSAKEFKKGYYLFNKDFIFPRESAPRMVQTPNPNYSSQSLKLFNNERPEKRAPFCAFLGKIFRRVILYARVETNHSHPSQTRATGQEHPNHNQPRPQRSQPKKQKKPNTSSPGEDENTHLPRIGEKPKNGTGAGAHLALLGSIGEEVVAETRRGHLLTRLAVAGTSQSLTSWEGRTREIRSLFMGFGFGGLLCHRRSWWRVNRKKKEDIFPLFYTRFGFFPRSFPGGFLERGIEDGSFVRDDASAAQVPSGVTPY